MFRRDFLRTFFGGYVEKIAGTIDVMIRSFKMIDEIMSTMDFFSDKKYLRELIKIQTASVINGHLIHRHAYYREQLTAELYEAVGKTFRRCGLACRLLFPHCARSAFRAILGKRTLIPRSNFGEICVVSYPVRFRFEQKKSPPSAPTVEFFIDNRVIT